MKREWIAAGLLALLIGTATLNIVRADSLLEQISINLNRAEGAVLHRDYETAAACFDNGFSIWQDARNYTNVFLRHPDVDAAADAFYDLQQLLLQKDREALPAAFARLRYRLEIIDYMEHPSIGTIF